MQTVIPPLTLVVSCSGVAATAMGFPIPALASLTTHASASGGGILCWSCPTAVSRAQASYTHGDAPLPTSNVIIFLSNVFFLFFFLEGGVVFLCVDECFVGLGGASLPTGQKKV